MAQSLAPFNPDHWAPNIQETLENTLVAKAITDMSLERELRDGAKVHKPYIADLTVNDYVRGADVTIQDVNPTDEFIEINKSKEASFYVDRLDQIQNKYSAAQEYMDRAAYALQNEIDETVLGEYANAASFLDDGSIGGTGGNPITLTTANVAKVFSTARAKLRRQKTYENGDFFAVLTPETASIVEQVALTTGFNVADSAFKNGFAGTYLGFRVHVSNNITTASSVSHTLFGKTRCIDLALQARPEVLVTQPEAKIGKNYITWDLYGIKTFHYKAQTFLDVRIAA